MTLGRKTHGKPLEAPMPGAGWLLMNQEAGSFARRDRLRLISGEATESEKIYTETAFW